LQEPGSAEDIKKFVQGYNVQFKMMAKIDVNGKTAHPLWLYLEVLQQSWFISLQLSEVAPSMRDRSHIRLCTKTSLVLQPD
jgi:glutathione peroxidase-family protein